MQQVINKVGTNEGYSYLRKQIPGMMLLSLFPGLAYIALGWINDIYIAARFCYFAVVIISIRGYLLYKSFDIDNMSEASLEDWYDKTSILFYFFFLVWLVIFLIYAPESYSGMITLLSLQK